MSYPWDKGYSPKPLDPINLTVSDDEPRAVPLEEKSDRLSRHYKLTKACASRYGVEGTFGNLYVNAPKWMTALAFPQEERVCSGCELSLPHEMFPWKTKAKKDRFWECIACQRDRKGVD